MSWYRFAPVFRVPDPPLPMKQPSNDFTWPGLFCFGVSCPSRLTFLQSTKELEWVFLWSNTRTPKAFFDINISQLIACMSYLPACASERDYWHGEAMQQFVEQAVWSPLLALIMLIALSTMQFMLPLHAFAAPNTLLITGNELRVLARLCHRSGHWGHRVKQNWWSLILGPS